MKPRRPQLTIVKPVTEESGRGPTVGKNSAFDSELASFNRLARRCSLMVSRGASKARSAVWCSVKRTLQVVRYGVYYLMLWLRILVSWLSNLCAGVGLLVLLLAWLFQPGDYMWKIAGFSFGAFMVGWLYDSVLLLIAPEPIYLDGRMPGND